jgi:ADP-heptose:LPS heptosyltransferase
MTNNILVMRLDNIGDVIMTSPALRAIKENLPDCRLTLMASPGGAQAATLLPWVDEVLPWRVIWQDLGKLDFNPEREWELIRTLQARKFDAAIIFTSFSQSPHPPAFLCYLAGIPLRIGESKEFGRGVLTLEVPAASDDIHQVERNLRLVETAGFKVKARSLCIQIPNAAQQEALTLLSGSGKFPDDTFPTYLLLNPWTSCQSRNYDSQRFAIAARQLAEVTQMPVVVTGVEKDRDKSASLLAMLGDYAIDLIGKTTLAQLAALIANAKLVLSNNTSTMHIADGTRTPTIIMFAGTELESQWQPRNGYSRLLRRPTACSPCYAFICPYNLECLDISPEEVVATGLELLECDRPWRKPYPAYRYKQEAEVYT